MSEHAAPGLCSAAEHSEIVVVTCLNPDDLFKGCEDLGGVISCMDTELIWHPSGNVNTCPTDDEQQCFLICDELP